MVEIERSLPGFTGFVFEDVCREWVGRVSPLGSSASRIGSWWNRKSDLEVDVAVGEAVLDELLSARTAIGPKANQAELAIFAKHGFTDELAARAERERIHLITAADLFASKPAAGGAS